MESEAKPYCIDKATWTNQKSSGLSLNVWEKLYSREDGVDMILTRYPSITDDV